VAQIAGAQKVQRVVAQLVQIPWSHNLIIISKCKDVTEALYYANKTIEHNWSRNVLTHQIESGLYQREGKAVTNFAVTLPAPQSDLAQQLIKDPYNFDFLTLTRDYNERELEQALSDIHKPMGVSEYQLTRALPDNLKPSLPSIEELEAEFVYPEGGDA
jgi:predicted nuclease of restriction endonuclease-like (RecB) superfamily